MVSLVLGKSLLTPKSLCDPEMKSKTVILLDYSESVPKQTADAILERTWKFIEENVQEGELVSLFALSNNSVHDLEAKFSACKPRRDGNSGIESVKKVKKEFLQKFEKPLRAELAKPIPNGDESPIAQALIDLSLDDKHFRAKEVTRLLIFSDMLENSPKFSFYHPNGKRDCSQFVQKFRSTRVGSTERPKFNNTVVNINYIPRHNLGADVFQCRAYFWNWFFGDNKCKGDFCVNPDEMPG
jgi:hypothetical protein